MENKKEKRRDKYVMFCDGACEPKNPSGAMGIGCAVYKGKEIIKEYSYFLPAKPENTNNIAEYMAFIRALRHIIDEKLTGCSIVIKGDSQMCVNQLMGFWGVKKGAYVKYAEKAKELLKQVRKTNWVTFEWVPREQNKVADDLSKKELLKNNISITKRW